MGDRNKSGLEQRLSKIEKRLRRVECCAIMPPASNASGLQYGLLHFTVGDSGKLIIFSPYSETVQAAPATVLFVSNNNAKLSLVPNTASTPLVLPSCS